MKLLERTAFYRSLLRNRTSSVTLKNENVHCQFTTATKPHNRVPQDTLCRWSCGTRPHQGRRTFFSWFKKPEPQPVPAELDLPYEVVVPGVTSPMLSVPDGVMRPEYADSGVASPIHHLPVLLSAEETDMMREAGAMARKILDFGASHVQPGVTTDFIDKEIHAACVGNMVYPSTLNYRGFQKSVCTSVNNVMCHGVPDNRPLREGDIINIDFTVFVNGYHGDVSETYVVGSVDDKGQHLVDTARLCRDAAIQICAPLVPISLIGQTIQSIAVSAGFYVCPSFVGHGIGRQFHCKPDIWHYVNNYPEKMVPGMAFTIEPIILERRDSFVIADDGWTVLAENHTRSAQFEHTVLIIPSGFEVLTASPDENLEMETKSSSSSPDSDQEASASTEANAGKRNTKGDWTFD